SDVTHIEALRVVAFDVLGHHLERLLPDVVYLWFIALLLWASSGRSRVLGWVVMAIVVAAELAALGAALFDLSLPNLKIVMLLPFVWLLFEAGEGPSRAIADRAHREPVRRP
ncbi:MAG TPA: hypothetical protein VFT68_04250, partial [Lapillicoccus sp.]|nr:hypothetical protein [Lapillicoccus sp.]